MDAYAFHDKDLSYLSAPDVLEHLDYEALLGDRKSELNALMPLVIENGQPVLKTAQLIETDSEKFWKIPLNNEAGMYYLDLESDPATRILQADTYRELLIRQRINEAAVSVMVAYAQQNDLDVLAINYGTTRLIITPATDKLPAVMESDERLRKRTLLAIEGYARGGSIGWYMFNAMSASALVKDASVISPVPCEVVITILSRDGDGKASEELLNTVRAYIDGKYTRVLGDIVTVQSAEIVHYSVTADIKMYPGPSTEAILAQINANWLKYRTKSEAIGHSIFDSAIDSVLHQPGVYHAEIISPVLPITISDYQAPFCTGFTLHEVR